MNKSLFSGNLTRDPEMRTTTTGKQVCQFAIGVKKKHNKEESDFVNCSVFGALGDICMQYLHKGNKVLVIGSVSASAWNNKDGKAVAGLNLYVDEMEMLSPKKTGTASEAEAQSDPSGSGYIQVDDDDHLPF